MSTYNGFVFVLDEPERAQQIKDAFEHFGDFTDTISTPDWRPKTVEICFISFDGENLDFAALGKRGRRVATNKDQIRFSSPMDLNSLPFDRLEELVELMREKIAAGKRIIVFGNGGSASTASHFVCDLAKGVFTGGGPRIKALSLNDCIPLMTAWSNDEGYDRVFVEPLANYLEEGDISDKGTHMLSTSGMMRHARESDASKFIVATETGILYRMQKENPDKEFIPADPCAVCKYMKMITLENLRDALKEMKYEVKVPDDIAAKARVSIERMLEIA